ncbi:MAG: TIGR02099 family protein [Gammaproteobacteria bacterium]|nr:TIGR02099 family protein [Gammaproteobacteria bacterium]NIR98796.1 TIGR02099 family protein [Gammaproteobacteria bacterium]NIT64506.1 TIGR02099 family protein [Gammaproteobacteria bacterium]NIV21426.1 TIGR02099 family protein [Gammaproteobacteria bacterium]NIX11296.1 TIGR02099 family protein [Gammaproteobacteria bacterium]
MKRLFQRLLGAIWIAFATVVLTAAVLVSVARMLLPLLQDYRSDIERFATEQLGRPVKIGRIDAGWQGLHPELRAVDVQILDPSDGATWLHLTEVRASVDLAASLVHRRVETREIRFIGANIGIVRHDDGTYSVAGLETGRGGFAGQGGRRLVQWLVGRERVSIVDGTLVWTDRRFSTRPLQLTDVALHLDKAGAAYRLNGGATIAGEPDHRVRFVARVRGEPRRPQALHTRFYLEGRLPLGRYADGAMLRQARVPDGELGFQLWGEGQDRLERLSGDLRLEDLRWSGRGGGERAPGIEELAARVFWQRRDGGWDAALERVRLARNGRPWPSSSAHVQWRAGTGDRAPELRGRATFLRLEDAGELLSVAIDAGGPVRSVLDRLRPHGDLSDLVFRLTGPNWSQGPFFVRARFQDLGVARWRAAPGISGLDGSLVASHARGYVDLRAEHAELDFPRLFRGSVHADRLEGRFYVGRDTGSWRIRTRRFTAANQDIHGQGRFDLTLPTDGGSPFLDMQMAFGDGQAAQARRYLPVGVMSPKVVKWLDRGLVGGRVSHGGLVFLGPTRSFPFEDGRGTFLISFSVEDAILDYAKGWHRAEGLTGQVTFRDRTFRARIDSGKIFDLDVAQARVGIPEMGKQAVLELEGSFDGPVADMVRYLRESPISMQRHALFGRVAPDGPGQLRVQVRIPLRQPETGSVAGTLHLDDASLGLPAWDVVLTRMNGDLSFFRDPNGLRYRADGISARYHGQDAEIQVRRNDDARLSRVVVQTRLEPARLLGARTEHLGRFLRGRGNWRIELDVPDRFEGPARLGLRLRSSLGGVEVNLPGDLAKSAATRRDLTVAVSLSAEGPGPLRLGYGAHICAVLQASAAGGVERGAVHFGPGCPELPGTGGVHVTGSMARFSVDEWRRWLAANDPSGEGAGVLGLLERIHVSVGRLELFNMSYRKVRLSARRGTDYWHATVDSRELAGTLRVPQQLHEERAVAMDLKHLRLSLPAGGGHGKAPDPRSLPPLKISADEVTFDRAPLGRLELAAAPRPSGLHFERLHLEGPHLELDASGDWTMEGESGLSRFEIRANTDDLGTTLEDLGYAAGVDGGEGVARATVHWSGPPSWFSVERVDGTVRLLVKHGRLLRLDPGGGRVFGLLSLQALPRRLALDFSDIAREGFSFDRIEGSFVISDGDAYTNDLYMIGPSAHIEVSGRVGLTTRDYDQHVIVTPQVSSTIPLVGGLAGGPGVGLGLWVAERIFGKKIDRMTRVHYTVAGGWDDPVVERLKKEQLRGEPSGERPRPQAPHP